VFLKCLLNGVHITDGEKSVLVSERNPGVLAAMVYSARNGKRRVEVVSLAAQRKAERAFSEEKI